MALAPTVCRCTSRGRTSGCISDTPNNFFMARVQAVGCPLLSKAEVDRRPAVVRSTPQERTSRTRAVTSEKCQQATSFDHLVGAGDEGSRKIEAEGFCRLQVNHQIIFGRSLDRKIGRLLALENAIDITGRAPKLVDAIGPVENQPAAVDIVSVAIHGRKSVLGS